MKFFNIKQLQKDIPELGGMIAYSSFVDPQIDRVIPAGLPSWAGSAAKVIIGSGLRTNKSAIIKGIGNAMLVVGANEIGQEIAFIGSDSASTTGVSESITNSVSGI